MNRELDVAVIGAGQAGLAMGRELTLRGQNVMIFDAARRVGDSWRNRWDSLRLFTPARHSALPGLKLELDPDHYPSKDELADYLLADYLEDYARRFRLPLALDEGVLEAHRDNGAFTIRTAYDSYRARQIVVATGPFQSPAVPAIGAALPAGITQLHSSQYQRAEQLPDGPALVVGAGASGIQIAAELALTRPVTLALGTKTTRLPPRVLGRSVFDWLFWSGLMRVSGETKLGRRLRQRDLLVGDTPDMIARSAHVRLVGRLTHAADLNGFRSIIWATGFRPSYPWLHAGSRDERGWPVQRRGISDVRGLFFIGLPWQRSRASALVGGVGRDAAWLARMMS